MKYIYFFLSLFGVGSGSQAQFSSDATNPQVVCNQTNRQDNVRAINDSITTTNGYFVFWLDRRGGTAANGQVYGQRLDPDGNMLWENQGSIAEKASLKEESYWSLKWLCPQVMNPL
jgi:hypothetical protein